MILAAITAAGASERMGRAKALLDWHGCSFLGAMVRTARRALLPEIAVVVGGDADEVGAEAGRLGAVALPNPSYLAGRGTSIRAAAAWASRVQGTLLLWPVDCPAVSAATIRALADAAEVHPGTDLVPEFAGRGGHPVLLCPGTVEALRHAEDDLNLRLFLRTRPREKVRVPVDDPAVLENVNTPEDYRRFIDEHPPVGANREEDARV